MKKCRECGSFLKEFRDQTDKDGNTYHLIKCSKCSISVYSSKSITNCRNKWNELNKPLTYRDHAERLMSKLTIRPHDPENDIDNCIEIIEKYLENL
jgi:DNA-directed RNA polymerase subunit M/transcription elongation factor TFIIS